MNSPLGKRVFTAVAFVALAGMLAFGGGIRYFCYCSGAAVLTLHEHCHGVHGEKGPVDHAPAGHRHGDRGDHGDRERGDHDGHRHELVESSTELRLPDVVTAPGAKPLPLLWAAASEGETARAGKPAGERPRPRIAEDPPPLSQRVARSVVRLI